MHLYLLFWIKSQHTSLPKYLLLVDSGWISKCLFRSNFESRDSLKVKLSKSKSLQTVFVGDGFILVRFDQITSILLSLNLRNSSIPRQSFYHLLCFESRPPPQWSLHFGTSLKTHLLATRWHSTHSSFFAPSPWCITSSVSNQQPRSVGYLLHLAALYPSPCPCRGSACVQGSRQALAAQWCGKPLRTRDYICPFLLHNHCFLLCFIIRAELIKWHQSRHIGFM